MASGTGDGVKRRDKVSAWVDTCCAKGELLTLIGRRREAEAFLRGILVRAGELGIPERQKTAVFRGLGTLLRLMGSLDEALNLLEGARDVYHREGASGDEGATLINLGSIHEVRNDYETARSCYQQGYDIAKHTGNARNMFSALSNLGNLCKNRGDYPEALELVGRALQLAQEVGDKRLIGIAANNMGIILRETGEVEKALACYQKRLETSKEIGDKMGMCISLCNLGVANLDADRYQLAKEQFESLYELAVEIGDKQAISYAVGNLGLAHYELGDYDKALGFCRRDLELAEERGDKRDIAIALGSMAKSHKGLGQGAQAKERIDRAISICREFDIKYYLCGYLLDLAEMLFEEGDISRSMAIKEEAVEIAAEISRPDVSFQAELLGFKAGFKLDPERTKDALKTLTEKAEGDQHKAEALYTWALLVKDESTAREALAIFDRLFQDTGRHLYRMRRDELEACFKKTAC